MLLSTFVLLCKDPIYLTQENINLQSEAHILHRFDEVHLLFIIHNIHGRKINYLYKLSLSYYQSTISY